MAGATTDDPILLDENEAAPQIQPHHRQRVYFSEPQPIVEVIVQSVSGLDTFHVHRQLLVESAPVFREWLETTGDSDGDGTGAGASLTLPPEVTTADFGRYVEALYHWNFRSGPAFTPATTNVPLSNNIGLLKVARLAGDELIQRVAEKSIHAQIRRWWSAERWELLCRDEAAELAHRLQTLYQHCKLNDFPFGEDIVAAVAYVPPSLFARLATTLETTFLVAVSKKFGERMDSEGKQRAQESGKSKKKRKASHISQDD
ncbi:hypothetical protein MAPG_06579 [Magnaporthiopsis poae ATCC 64411]|uniref:BTB domain-containing protein n=1 Tax=Magnaporthiopsis poae (strain ATCC 64411 / 73-15) TaxID=644358 RepID=A0A0C4E2E4_MAGP6|nr:hypothetical protein MAPG_06579 [Magnaporthiopsis poae ATCC 64411]